MNAKRRLCSLLVALAIAAPAMATINDPIDLWKADENTGTAAADNGSSPHAGTLTNGATWSAPGKLGASAFSLDGTNDFIDCGSFAPPSTISVGLWIKQSSAATKVIVSQFTDTNGGFNAGAYFDQFLVNSDGSLQANIFTSSASLIYIGRTSPAAGVAANTWTHVCFTYDGGTASSGVKIYINGAAVDNANSTAGSFGGPNTASLPFRIGTRFVSNAAASPFNGSIDDIRVYNRVLSAAEVSALYQFPISCRAYYLRQQVQLLRGEPCFALAP
jgi:hypothetical protein